MALSGTVPARETPRVDPARMARWLRRATLLIGVTGVVWFFVKFETRWVPNGMNTLPEMPPGSWCIVDRWSSGLRVGSDVFVDSPVGSLLSRVTRLDDDGVFVENVNPQANLIDSRTFGAIPRDRVRGVVVVAFPAGETRGR